MLATYDLEKSIRIEGGPRLVMLPFVKNAIKMLLRDDKDKALEYLKLARETERLYHEIPDWYEAVMTSRFGPRPFHGFLDDDEDEDDRDYCSYDREEICDEEHGFKTEGRDTQGCGREETCGEEHRIEGKDQDTQRCGHEETCNRKRELEDKDQHLHDYNKDKDHCKLTRSARDLQSYDRDKD
mgnify:CR=1 FL=1